MPQRKDSIQKAFTYEGKRYYVRGSTEEECLEKKEALLSKLEQGKTKESNITVNQWFAEYIKTYKANVSPGTLSNYKGIYDSAIRPYLGALKLKTIKPAQIQKAYNQMDGKSKSYIHKARILMQGMFEAAVDNQLIRFNPTRGTTPPKGDERERRALTETERKVFLEAASHLDRAGLFCLIIYYTGLRPSEVARVKGKDIKKGVLHVDGTKTKAATRDVPIPDVLKLPKLKSNELLFKTSTGRAVDKRRIEGFWNSVKREMAIVMGEIPSKHGKVSLDRVADDLTMYCLRHDYCTRLQEAGVPIDVARRIMGHSSISVTSKIYTHASVRTLEDAARLINTYNK